MKKLISKILVIGLLFCANAQAQSGLILPSQDTFFNPVTFNNQVTQYVDVAGSSNPYYLNDFRLRLTSGTQSDDFRLFNLNLHSTDAASSTGAGGNGFRLLHAGVVHDSTNTVEDLNVAQFNCIGGVQGSSVNLGNIATCESLRILIGFSTSGTANIDEAFGIHILSPNNTSAGNRTIGEYTGLKIEDLDQGGVSNPKSIVTGTGNVEFGDYVKHGAAQADDVTSTGSGNYTVLSSDYFILKTAITVGGDTITLPENPEQGQVFIIKDGSGNAGANNITIDTTGAPTIDGAATATISTNYDWVQVIFQGSNYYRH